MAQEALKRRADFEAFREVEVPSLIPSPGKTTPSAPSPIREDPKMGLVRRIRASEDVRERDELRRVLYARKPVAALDGYVAVRGLAVTRFLPLGGEGDYDVSGFDFGPRRSRRLKRARERARKIGD